MQKILDEICKHFCSNQERFNLFSEEDVRIEGWIKGELLYLLTELKSKNDIDDFKAEVGIDSPSLSMDETPVSSDSNESDRKRVDFRIKKNGILSYFEIKTLCISRKRTNRSVNFYFRDDSVGIIQDFQKLNSSDWNQGSKHVIAFIYPGLASDYKHNRKNTTVEKHWENVLKATFDKENIIPKVKNWNFLKPEIKDCNTFFIAMWTYHESESGV